MAINNDGKGKNLRMATSDFESFFDSDGKSTADSKTFMRLLKIGDYDEFRNPDKNSKHNEGCFGFLKGLSMDVLKVISVFLLVSLIGAIFNNLGFKEDTIITVYVLGVLVISVVTSNRIYSLISSCISVVGFSFLFAEPTFNIHVDDQEYIITFIMMFLAAFMTGTLASKLRDNARSSARAAFRTKVLFDTNQLLQQATDEEEIVTSTASQLLKLLDRNIVVYLFDGKKLGEGRTFLLSDKNCGSCLTSEDEKKAAAWCILNNTETGFGTKNFTNAKCLYYPVSVNDKVYGSIGVLLENRQLDSFLNNIFQSILGECALALSNVKNAREKEEAAVLAKNEQLRANLLRAISHDLRTPLTSISGNASNLLSNGDSFDKETKQQLYRYIYDDSMWLINLVENLLSVTRLEEGRLNLHISEDVMDDVVAEALNHVNRLNSEHNITFVSEEDILLAKMDAKLIVQVIINIVDNAIKYTPDGSTIEIRTRKEGDFAVVSISDDGPGISDELKPRIFDMFYSGANKIPDCRRSLGLGLSLCRSIINAHGGKITVSDNIPKGTVFTFTLPAGEVKLHE